MAVLRAKIELSGRRGLLITDGIGLSETKISEPMIGIDDLIHHRQITRTAARHNRRKCPLESVQMLTPPWKWRSGDIIERRMA